MHFSVVCLVDYFSREYPYDCIFFHRNALSSAFSCWEALLGEYEKQAQVLVDCTKGRYKSRTGSTRTTSPGRIDSDQLGLNKKIKIK